MFTGETLEVVMVSLEGPDRYSLAGGLGVRSRELCKALAAAGLRTTLVFCGDAQAPPEEMVDGVRLVRWAQDVSRRHPNGVYEGEYEKTRAFDLHLPAWIADTIVAPAAAERRTVAVFAEEWHTASFCNALSDMLYVRGLRNHCAILWNANNTFGFDRINWGALGYVAAVTTVSRYMKHLMWEHGVNPMVIPNGIPEASLTQVEYAAVRAIHAAAGTPCLTVKRGRFSADKRWNQAVSAIAQLRADGVPGRMIMRGGIEPYGGEVIHRARAQGLEVVDWYEPIEDVGGLIRALVDTGEAAVINLCRFVPDDVIPPLDVASTAVLANSGHEPFGLVGLEAMASGAVAIVGSTGEEYALPYGNAIVTETDDPAEVAAALRGLIERPELAARLRYAARRDAADFTWPRVVEGLLERLRFVCLRQRVVVYEPSLPVPVPPPIPASAPVAAGKTR